MSGAWEAARLLAGWAERPATLPRKLRRFTGTECQERRLPRLRNRSRASTEEEDAPRAHRQPRQERQSAETADGDEPCPALRNQRRGRRADGARGRLQLVSADAGADRRDAAVDGGSGPGGAS